MKIIPLLSKGSVCVALTFSLTSFSFNTFFKNISHHNRSSYIQDENEVLRQKWDKAIGTFQFQIVNSRENPVIPVKVIELIESSRKANEVVFVKYNDVIRIKILPKSIIQGDFEKLETFIYVTE